MVLWVPFFLCPHYEIQWILVASRRHGDGECLGGDDSSEKPCTANPRMGFLKLSTALLHAKYCWEFSFKSTLHIPTLAQLSTNSRTTTSSKDAMNNLSWHMVPVGCFSCATTVLISSWKKSAASDEKKRNEWMTNCKISLAPAVFTKRIGWRRRDLQLWNVCSEWYQLHDWTALQDMAQTGCLLGSTDEWELNCQYRQKRSSCLSFCDAVETPSSTIWASTPKRKLSHQFIGLLCKCHCLAPSDFNALTSANFTKHKWFQIFWHLASDFSFPPHWDGNWWVMRWHPAT